MVSRIDTDCYYPKEVLQLLGEHGYFQSGLLPYEEMVRREVEVVEEVSKFCMTTDFNIWRHLAALMKMKGSLL